MAKKVPVLPLAESAPGPPLQVTFQLTFATTGVPIQCPAYRVPPGASVNIYTVNSGGVNANKCSIAEYPEALNTSSGRIIPPGADVTVPWAVQNTSEIWAVGTEGDGILITINLAAIG